jgi:hypothetical protein
MFKWLSNYRRKNKERSKKEQRINGFDYAAGKLLRNESTPHELESHIIYIDYDYFDCGIIAAIIKLKEIGFIEEELDFLEEPFKFNENYFVG